MACGPTPLVGCHPCWHVRSRVHLAGSCLHTGVVRHQRDGMVQVCGFTPQDAPYLLFGLRIGAIGERHLAVLVPRVVAFWALWSASPPTKCPCWRSTSS